MQLPAGVGHLIPGECVLRCYKCLRPYHQDGNPAGKDAKDVKSLALGQATPHGEKGEDHCQRRKVNNADAKHFLKTE